MSLTPHPHNPTNHEVLDAIKILSNHQADIASQLLPVLIAWCETKREWVREAWIQFSDDCRKIEFFVGLLVPYGVEDAKLNDEVSDLDLQMHQKLQAINSPWTKYFNSLTFRVDEPIESFMKFNNKTATLIFP